MNPVIDYKDYPKPVLKMAVKEKVESEGNRFLRINWKKRIVHFVTKTGAKKSFYI